MQPKAFHSRCTIIAERTRFNHIVLTDMLVLKVSAHSDLSLKTTVTYRAMVWQSLRMCRKVFRKMVLPKESLLTYPTFVRFHACMPHLKEINGEIGQMFIDKCTINAENYRLYKKKKDYILFKRIIYMYFYFKQQLHLHICVKILLTVISINLTCTTQ